MKSSLFFSGDLGRESPSGHAPLQDLTGGRPRPRFADALPLVVADLGRKARVEVQLDAAALSDFDDRDRDALGLLLRTAADLGRPFAALVAAPPAGGGSPFTAFVSYDGARDPRGLRACRLCGCIDADCRGCVERTGRPCRWVAADLCSACVAGPGPRDP